MGVAWRSLVDLSTFVVVSAAILGLAAVVAARHWLFGMTTFVFMRVAFVRFAARVAASCVWSLDIVGIIVAVLDAGNPVRDGRLLALGIQIVRSVISFHRTRRGCSILNHCLRSVSVDA